MRLALGVEYAGENFFGWQTQEKVRTVQQCVEQALSRVANHPVSAQCAGRTDRGVHAFGQVIHAEVHAVRKLHAWVLGTNTYLPADVKILWAHPVDDTFNARFTAMQRHYRYMILNRLSPPAVFAKKMAWEYRPLDVEKMHAAGQYLVGKHDFSSFRAAGCQAKHPIRTLSFLRVTRHGDQVHIDVSADGFLYHMVRNITGVLLEIGRGSRSVDWAKTVLESRDRNVAAMTAPADGLYFCGADYPEQYNLPRWTRE